MTNIVLFGPPGAGKGTQAKKLVDKYGFNHISTGEVIREEIRKGSEVGNMLRERIERGELAEDHIVLAMIDDYLRDHANRAGNVFDGFPRTTVQAREFDVLLTKYGHDVDVMISLIVPDDVLTGRLLMRGIDGGRMDDGGIEVIHRRIEVYNAQTAVVAEYYAAQDKYVTVDGTGGVEDVFDRLCEVIDRYVTVEA